MGRIRFDAPRRPSSTRLRAICAPSRSCSAMPKTKAPAGTLALTSKTLWSLRNEPRFEPIRPTPCHSRPSGRLPEVDIRLGSKPCESVNGGSVRCHRKLDYRAPRTVSLWGTIGRPCSGVEGKSGAKPKASNSSSRTSASTSSQTRSHRSAGSSAASRTVTDHRAGLARRQPLARLRAIVASQVIGLRRAGSKPLARFQMVA